MEPSDATIPERPLRAVDVEAPALCPGSARRTTALAFAVLLAAQAVGLVLQHPTYDTDDAAFFYRYAENLANGDGFRFNVEDPPVWGASAPFWPVLLALGMKLGLGPLQSAQAWSWILTLAATALLGRAALRLAGVAGVLALAPLVSANYLYASFATAGMESPLGYFAVGLTLAAACGTGSGALLGVAAGLCLVHKIDLVPLGLTALAGAFLWKRGAAWRASAIAAAIAAAWYGFAWLHFGSPVPNSLVSKYTATYGGVGHAWFGGRLLVGAGILRIALALLGVVAQRARPYPVLIALAGVLAPLAAYSLKPPAEPFQWYAAAVTPSLAFLGALGLAALLRAIARPASTARIALAGVGLAALTGLIGWLDAPHVRSRNAYMTGIEPLRIAAGHWVDEHAPLDARVLCAWGHVAYHARRYVYDVTFLNRPHEKGDLVKKYQPEVLVTHCDTERPKRFKGYRMVKRFVRPSSPGRTLSYDVYLRGDLFPEQLGRFVAGPEAAGAARVSPAACEGLAKWVQLDALPVNAPPGALDELEGWIAELSAALQQAPPALAEDARRLEPWLELLQTRAADLRAARGPG